MKTVLSAHGVLAVLAIVLVVGLIIFGVTGTSVSSFYEAISYSVLGAFVSVNGGKAVSDITAKKTTGVVSGN